jgi:hypothetical protein
MRGCVAVWAIANSTDVRRFAMLTPTKVCRPHAGEDRNPWRRPRNTSSSTIGCQTTANRKDAEAMRCHGNGSRATRCGKIHKKAAPRARHQTNVGAQSKLRTSLRPKRSLTANKTWDMAPRARVPRVPRELPASRVLRELRDKFSAIDA